MTLVVVADLIGDDLDIAVALADGHRVRRSTIVDAPGIHEQRPGGAWEWIRRPSTAWDHGSPIIERARIDLVGGAPWRAICGDEGDIDGPPTGLGEGPTPLVAAMRAYVASKFGETIDLESLLVGVSRPAS